MQQRNLPLHRISQFIGFLLGARFFVTVLLTFALYVSTFFLFNQEESLRKFVFDLKVHGIIFCAVLSILAGGIINQFYDREKDQITKPFRSRLQSFLKQKYFLYAYLALSILSLAVALMISHRVFIFFLIYQFFMWFYSHKLSKILIVNNLTFVSLTMYPFFGMLYYFRTFSVKVFFMAMFLFLIILMIDILKDTLTKNADKVFGYRTIPNFFGRRVTAFINILLLLGLVAVSMSIIEYKGLFDVMSYYFAGGRVVFSGILYFVLEGRKNSSFVAMNLLRFWVFIGICAMLLDGILTKF